MSTDDTRGTYDAATPRRTDGEARPDLGRTAAVDTDRDGYRDTDVYPATDTDRPVVVDRDRDVVARDVVERDVVVDRERERFGGFKFGSAFFGWLTALGALVTLTAVVAAIGAATGMISPRAVEDAAQAANENMGAATIIGAIVLAVVLFVAYFAGGYVAGRMARFSGAKQGLAVWIWAIVIAIIVAIVTMLAGSEWDILANVDIFPRIPVTAETATLTGILTAIGAAVITLIAAILGGLAGMRYHRRVDRVGLGY